MDEEERQKLVEKRKREQEEKKFLYDIERDLKPKFRKRRIKSIRKKYENKYVGAAIIFFGTLLPLYLFVFVAYYFIRFFFAPFLIMLNISLSWLPPFLHIGIWLASGISVIRDRSVVDDLLDKFVLHF